MSKLEEEHNQALELTANRAALVKKELESLQQETAKMKYRVFRATDHNVVSFSLAYFLFLLVFRYLLLLSPMAVHIVWELTGSIVRLKIAMGKNSKIAKIVPFEVPRERTVIFTYCVTLSA